VLRDAGIVDDDVDPPEPLQRECGEPFDESFRRDVADDGLGRAARRDAFARDLFQPIGAARGQDDRRAARSKVDRDLPSDPGRRPGDDDDAAPMTGRRYAQYPAPPCGAASRR
jgi:hypothetical protein